MRNAFNGALIRELAAAFAALAADAGVRAIVLGGSGKAFCAGADLALMREVGRLHLGAEPRRRRRRSPRCCGRSTAARCRWSRRIHGDCYAGGVGLASVCDIRVVAERVTFCLSEARLGLLPATISPYVVRAMGEQAARRYFVTAERFGAAEAQRAAASSHEVVRGRRRSTPRSTRSSTAIVANGPMATRACKKLVQDVAGREINAELRAETARRIADIRASAEGTRGHPELPRQAQARRGC